jgi:hypothetical protein
LQDSAKLVAPSTGLHKSLTTQSLTQRCEFFAVNKFPRNPSLANRGIRASPEERQGVHRHAGFKKNLREIAGSWIGIDGFKEK